MIVMTSFILAEDVEVTQGGTLRLRIADDGDTGTSNPNDVPSFTSMVSNDYVTMTLANETAADTVYSIQAGSKTITEFNVKTEDDEGADEGVGFQYGAITAGEYNISNSTDDFFIKTGVHVGAGTVTFAQPFPDVEYSVVLSVYTDSDTAMCGVDTDLGATSPKNAGSFKVECYDDVNNAETVTSVDYVAFTRGEYNLSGGIEVKAGYVRNDPTPTVTYLTPFPDTNYAVFLTLVTEAFAGTSACTCVLQSKSTTGFQAACWESDGTACNSLYDYDYIAIEIGEQNYITNEPPVSFLDFPANETVLTVNHSFFNATCTDDVGLANVTYSIWNSTDLVNETTVDITGLSNATGVNVTLPREDDYYWNAQCCEAAEYCASNATNYTVTFLLPDDKIPIFTDLEDNNATLVDMGTAEFNVTIENTNGTVLLEIDDVNYTATNISAVDKYNVSISFDSFSGGDYEYTWHAWGNGYDEVYNITTPIVYTINTTGNFDANESTLDGVACEGNDYCHLNVASDVAFYLPFESNTDTIYNWAGDNEGTNTGAVYVSSGAIETFYTEIGDIRILNATDHTGDSSPHTLSVVRPNKTGQWGGHTYWMYVGEQIPGGGSVKKFDLWWTENLTDRSNYTTYGTIMSGNEIRWPTVEFDNDTQTFWMAHTKYYVNVGDYERIVLKNSSDGITFSNEVAITPYGSGLGSNNPNFFDNREVDGNIYMVWNKYDGSTNMVARGATTFTGLITAEDHDLVTSNAAPDMFYQDSIYWLLTERLDGGLNWVTDAWFDTSPTGTNWRKTDDSPILDNQDACPMVYIEDDVLYDFICQHHPDDGWVVNLHTNDLTDTKTVSTEAKSGRAIHFDDYADDITFTDPVIADNFTLGLWFKPSGCSVGDVYLVDKWGGAGNAAFAAKISVGASYDPMYFEVDTYDGAAPSSTTGTVNVPGINSWVHYVMSINGTNLKTWVNGVADIDTTVLHPMNSSTNMVLMSGRDGKDCLGYMDEVIILDHPASDQEVAELYGLNKSKFGNANQTFEVDVAAGHDGFSVKTNHENQNSSSLRVRVHDGVEWKAWQNVGSSGNANDFIISDSATKVNVTYNYSGTEDRAWSPILLSQVEVSIYDYVANVKPESTLTSPNNESILTVPYSFFNVTCTDDFGLANVTYHIWNSTDEINVTTIDITGTTNLTGLNISLPRDDDYLWNAKCCDASGLCDWDVNRTVTLSSADIVNPTITITEPVNTTNSTDTALDVKYVTSDDTAVDSCKWSDDLGVSNTTLPTCANLTGSWSDVTHTIWIWVNDTSGNEARDDVTFTIDSTAPLVEIIYPINGTTYLSVVDLNYTHSENLPDSCWYSNDSGLTNQSEVVAGTNFTAMETVEGLNNWTVYCNDTVGNENSSVVFFTIDTTAPTITFITPAQDAIFLLNYSGWINVSISETGGNCSINDTRWDYYSDNTTHYNFINTSSFTTNETISVNISCWDANSNNDSALLNFTLDMDDSDTTLPTITIHSPVNGTTQANSTIVLNVTADETIDTWWYSNDSGITNLTFSPNITIPGYPEGLNNITVFANDSAGNENESTVFFTIDTTAPTITFITPEQDEVFLYNYTGWINLSISETGGNCSLNDTRWTYQSDNTTHYNFINASAFTSNETASVNFSCWDDSDNNDSTVLNFVLNMNATAADTTPPTIVIHSPTDTSYLNTTIIDLNVTSDGTESIWWYSNDSGLISNLTFSPNISIGTYPEGSNNITVFVNDSSGNENSSMVFFTVDATSPLVEIYRPENTTYTSASVPVDIRLDESGYCEYSLNGADNVTTTANSTNTGFTKTLSLSDGNYNLTAYCNNTVGLNNYSEIVFFTVAITATTTPSSGGGGGGGGSSSPATTPSSPVITTIRIVKEGIWSLDKNNTLKIIIEDEFGNPLDVANLTIQIGNMTYGSSELSRNRTGIYFLGVSGFSSNELLDIIVSATQLNETVIERTSLKVVENGVSAVDDVVEEGPSFWGGILSWFSTAWAWIKGNWIIVSSIAVVVVLGVVVFLKWGSIVKLFSGKKK